MDKVRAFCLSMHRERERVVLTSAVQMSSKPEDLLKQAMAKLSLVKASFNVYVFLVVRCVFLFLRPAVHTI
jgi:hypothetical protein